MIRVPRDPFGHRAGPARARLATITTDPSSPPRCSNLPRSRSPRGDRARFGSLTSRVLGPFRMRSPFGNRLRTSSLTLRCSRSRTDSSPYSARSVQRPCSPRCSCPCSCSLTLRRSSPSTFTHPSSGTPVLLVKATHPCSPREGSRSCFMRSHLSMLAHVPRTCSPRSVHVRARLHDPPFDFSCMRGTRLCSPIFAFTIRSHLSMLTRRVRRVLQDMLAFRRSHPVPRAGSRFSRTPFDARASVLCSLKPPFDSSKPQLAVSVSTKHARLSTLTSVFAAGCPRP